ncbi:hypothetical protein [Limoniibacter endophyticus]|uniref:Uncharacterized protein n=1 Tax=Limoniibacter endophyticus TaxID=1565040 RepID=A0A8J3DFU6_9HYPH|nr:hypothetical protein [Limoniibacter endophyticus]GHC62433.1 hypothetical protein GCM10010136_03540 [Limoniibacter endophyticus]
MKQARKVAQMATLALFVANFSSSTVAQERAYVWVPSKLNDSAYKVRSGINYQNGWQASGGTDFSLAADKHGKLVENAARVAVWGRAVDEAVEHGRTVRRELDLNVDTRSGRGQISIKRMRRWIATEKLDVEVVRNLTLQCNSYEAYCHDANASQSVRLSVPETKTAIVARSSISSNNTDVTNSLSIEQNALQNVNLNLTLNNPARDEREASARASYGWRW